MRNNGFSLEMNRFKKEIGKHWSSNRMVDEWIGFRNQVVSAVRTRSFKRKLNKYMNGDARWK